MPSNLQSPLESFDTGYCNLFQVRLLHRYFLNVGNKEFDDTALSTSNKAAVEAVRKAYDVRQFWRIEPSPATQALLRAQRLLFRTTADGFRVAAQGRSFVDGTNGTTRFQLQLRLPAQVDFTFLAYPTDPAFSLYTQLTPEILQQLPASLVCPQGRVLLLFNLNGQNELSSNDTPTTTTDGVSVTAPDHLPTATATPLMATAAWQDIKDVLSGSAGTPLDRPQAVICIRHGDPAQSPLGLLGGQTATLQLITTTSNTPADIDPDPPVSVGTPRHVPHDYTQALTYQAIFTNRATAWQYKGKVAQYGLNPDAFVADTATKPLLLPLVRHGAIDVSTYPNTPTTSSGSPPTTMPVYHDVPNPTPATTFPSTLANTNGFVSAIYG